MEAVVLCGLLEPLARLGLVLFICAQGLNKFFSHCPPYFPWKFASRGVSALLFSDGRQFVNFASCCSAINTHVLRTTWPQFLICTFIPEIIFVIHVEAYSKEEATQTEA